MRILHVFDHSLPLHSGYTFRSRAILKAQQGLGLEVCGITGLRHGAETGEPSETIDPEVVDGLTFYRTPGKISGPPMLSEFREMARLSKAIQSVAAKFHPDIIHAHSPVLNGGAALHAARVINVPLVYEIRAFWEDAAVGNKMGRHGSAKYRLTKAFETQVVKRADAVFTICEGLRDDLIRRGLNAGRIGIMPNGVDLSLFGEPSARDAALAESLGIGADDPVIGFVGSFYDYEGLDDLIAALPLLQENYPNTKLLLVGGGPMDKSLHAQAAALPDPACVIFTGRVPHDEVERYYSLIDLLAYPRKKSRLTDLVTPLKPLEAMAQRRIVTASDVGGHRELITDGETGFLFAPDTPSACASALADALDSRGRWGAIRDTAQKYVADHHDWARNARCYLDVYQTLLAPNPR